jgi:hypothetical protein
MKAMEPEVLLIKNRDEIKNIPFVSAACFENNELYCGTVFGKLLQYNYEGQEINSKLFFPFISIDAVSANNVGHFAVCTNNMVLIKKNNGRWAKITDDRHLYAIKDVFVIPSEDCNKMTLFIQADQNYLIRKGCLYGIDLSGDNVSISCKKYFSIPVEGLIKKASTLDGRFLILAGVPKHHGSHGFKGQYININTKTGEIKQKMRTRYIELIHSDGFSSMEKDVHTGNYYITSPFISQDEENEISSFLSRASISELSLLSTIMKNESKSIVLKSEDSNLYFSFPEVITERLAIDYDIVLEVD